MIIANPIYDVVFKRLMENERVAKFFIGTLLDETVERVEVQPQELTYHNDLIGLSVFRLDFVATIRTGSGELKKVLIEIQKAKNQVDLMRFRRYLAEQYKKEDHVGGKKVVLPITTIYILGFVLPGVDSACLKVERQYRDLVEDRVLTLKSEMIESLTHDSYVVQVERISGRYQTRLDKLLSVFEQRYFTGDEKTTKNFPYPADIEEVKLLTDILHYSGTDPEERKQIEIEAEAWRSVNALFENKERELLEKLQAKEEEVKKKEEEIAEKDRLIAELQEQLTKRR